MLFSMGLFSQNLKLTVYGETELKTAKIDSVGYNANHKDFESINNEVYLLNAKLQKIGYIESDVEFIKKTNDSSFNCKIVLKRRYKTIHIYYNTSTVSEKILKMVSGEVNLNYFTLNIENVEAALVLINQKLSEQGQPFLKLKLSDFKPDAASSLSATLVVESKSDQRTIDNIIVKGYDKFPKSFLKHYLKIKPKQVFDLKRIQEKTEQLRNLRFANEIKPPEVLFTKDSTTLYLYIKKNTSNTFDGFLGFGTNEQTNKLDFDGYLNLSLNNNLNYGESFRLLYKSDENAQKTFESNLTLPYLFKSPIGIDFLLRIFKRDTSFTTVNQSVKAFYQVNSKHKIYTGIQLTESNNLLSTNTTNSILDYKTFYTNVGYEFIQPQFSNLLFPIKSKLLLETNFGKRSISQESENQILLIIDAFKIFNLNDKNSIYIRGNANNLNSKNYLENELIRFGGINSIRGFEENSLFASMYGLINTEYRYQIDNNIYLHSIIDFAYYQNKLTNIEEKLYGYGFGFGIRTNAGLLKFNYANGKNENSKFKLSNSKIHISLVTYF
ncbi:POTRA domain-containing protein [Siansivirga zeaxanthinifaciens]|nr:POTRA domain-containing protein [Siansivirga zeaxanthinifaciens]